MEMILWLFLIVYLFAVVNVALSESYPCSWWFPFIAVLIIPFISLWDNWRSFCLVVSVYTAIAFAIYLVYWFNTSV